MFKTFSVNAGPDNGFPSKVFSIVFVPGSKLFNGWSSRLRL